MREQSWDLIIAHPPCTHLCGSGNGPRKHKDPAVVDAAVEFARKMIEFRGCERVCVENPVGILSSRVRKPEQIVQPWMFGDPVRKRTCLWLRGLRRLQADRVVEPWDEGLWRMGQRMGRERLRSRTFQGLARAMAEQWG
jgi:hypothetical protein